MSVAATMSDTRTAGSKMRSIVFASSVGTIIEWYDFLIYRPRRRSYSTRHSFRRSIRSPDAGGARHLCRRLSCAAAWRRIVRAFRRSPRTQVDACADHVHHGAEYVLHRSASELRIHWCAAPILLILLRIVQGIGLGGEWGGASLMVIEHSPADKREFYGSFVQIGFPIGLVLATLVFGLRRNFPKPIFRLGVGVFRSLPASFCWRLAHSFDPGCRRRPSSRE